MVSILANNSIAFFGQSSSTFMRRTSSKRATKRKGVHFDKVHETAATSTSDYLFQEGKEWKQIAEYFNCKESIFDSEEQELNEMLVLCNWYDDKEYNPESPVHDDSEYEEADFSKIEFARSLYSTISGSNASSSNALHTESQPNNLRFNSLLRLDSKAALTTRITMKTTLEIVENVPVLTSNNISIGSTEKDELEKAFQGIMSTSPEPQCDVTTSEVELIVKEEKKKSDNFWDDVEF